MATQTRRIISSQEPKNVGRIGPSSPTGFVQSVIILLSGLVFHLVELLPERVAQVLRSLLLLWLSRLDSGFCVLKIAFEFAHALAEHLLPGAFQGVQFLLYLLLTKPPDIFFGLLLPIALVLLRHGDIRIAQALCGVVYFVNGSKVIDQ